jgi:hypothetical protein
VRAICFIRAAGAGERGEPNEERGEAVSICLPVCCFLSTVVS